MPTSVTRLAGWIARRPPQAIGLRVTYNGPERDEVVVSFEQLPDLSGPKSASATDLAIEILALSQEDCNGRESTSSYRIVWISANGEAVAGMTIKQFPSTGPAAEQGTGLDRDETSAAGVVGQALRHNELLLRTVMAAFPPIIGAYKELAEFQQTRIRILEAQLLETGAATAEIVEEQDKKEAYAQLVDVAKPILEAVLSNQKGKTAE